MINVNGRVFYTEPDYSSNLHEQGMNDSGSGVVKHVAAPLLENYCITANLIVEVPQPVLTASRGSGPQQIICSWRSDNSKTAVSIYNGTRCGAVNYLTTAYTDIMPHDLYTERETVVGEDGKERNETESEMMSRMSDKGTTELFGIKSIDIKYDSYVTPQVTIQFTDIRGAGLLMPEEMRHHDTGYADSNIASSFFKCFFTQPYPLFTLVVKGFYGAPVAYELSCAKFNYSLDSKNGNFDATAEFVGFAYSLLNDVTLNSLAAAPYDTYFGKSYWDSKVADGTFSVDKYGITVGMPTLADIMARYGAMKGYIKAAESGETVSETSADGTVKETTELESLSAKVDETQTALNTINEMMNNIPNVKGINFVVYENGFYCTGVSKENKLLLTSAYEVASEQCFKLAKKIQESLKSVGKKINTSFDLNKDTYDKGSNNGWLLIQEKQMVYSGPLLYDVTSGSTTPTSITTSTTINPNLLSDGYNSKHSKSSPTESATKKWVNTSNFNGLPNYIQNQINNTNYEVNVNENYRYIFYLDINDAVNQLQSKLTNDQVELNNSQEAAKRETQKRVIEAIGMTPTLYNITKVVMAHLETFIHSVYKCEDDVIGSNRTVSEMGFVGGTVTDPCLDTNETLSGGEESTNKSIVPPFPELYKKEDNKIVDVWMGNVTRSPKAYEIKLINGYLDGVKNMRKEMEDVVAQFTNSNDVNDIVLNMKYPVIPMDLFLPNNIWNFNGINSQNAVGALATMIGIRGAVVCNSVTDHDPFNQTKQAGKVDAENFFDKYPRPPKEFIDFINEKDKYNQKPSEWTYSFLNTTGITDSNYNIDKPWMTLNIGKIPLIFKNCYSYLLHNAWPVCNISFTLGGEFEKGTLQNGGEVIKPIDVNNYVYFSENTSIGNGANLDYYLYITTTMSQYSKIIEKLKDSASGGALNDNFEKLVELATNGVNQGNYGFCYKSDTKVLAKKWKTKGVIFGGGAVGDKYTYTFATVEGQSGFPTKQEPITVEEEFLYENCYFINEKGEIVKETRDMWWWPDNESFKDFFDDGGINGDYTIPSICGLDGNGLATSKRSIFMEQCYWNAANDYERASLFLGIFVANDDDKIGENIGGVNIKKCYEILTTVDDSGKSNIFALPYIFILFIGACSCYLHKKFECNSDIATKELNRLPINNIRYEVRLVFEKKFQDWVEGKDSNTISFPYIHKTFATIVEPLVGKEKVFQLIIGKNRKETVEKNLRDILQDGFSNFINTYISMTVGDGEDYAVLWLNENSSSVDKLTRFLLKPCLVIRPMDNIFSLEARDNSSVPTPPIPSEKVLKIYLENFYSNLKELYNNANKKSDETPIDDDTTEKNGEIEKHIRLALYKHIKNLYDRWLGGDLYLDGQNHWDLDRFFEGHFYFIDHFYNVCNDVFFDMEGMYSLWVNSLENESYSLLSFLSDSYAKSRSALFCTQNFLAMTSEPKKTETMFLPYSFSQSLENFADENKTATPDFIVMYSSEPSNRADETNSQIGCGDSFMLNVTDSNALPTALRNNQENGLNYNMPSFGVAYGTQYQSYFNNIKIDTVEPMATEQAIMAQYQIAGLNSKTGGEDGTPVACIGQDLYTIYSRQSYTCTVEMMGCAWVQPLMYFCLTNIPTFRGAYLIQKVQHSLRPGFMTTTFTGTRMSKFETPKVDKWYLGDFPSSEGTNENAHGENIASADNDCQYKVFSPNENKDGAWTDAMLNMKVSDFVQKYDQSAVSATEHPLYDTIKDLKVEDYLTAIACREVGRSTCDMVLLVCATVLFNSYTNFCGNHKYAARKGRGFGFLMQNFHLKGSIDYKNYFNKGSNIERASREAIRTIFKQTPACIIGKEVPLESPYGTSSYDFANCSAKFKQMFESKWNVGKTTTFTKEMARRITLQAAPKIFDQQNFLNVADVKNSVFSGNGHLNLAITETIPLWDVVTTISQETDETKTNKKTELESWIDCIEQTCKYTNAINIQTFKKTFLKSDNNYQTSAYCIISGDKAEDNIQLFDVALNAYGNIFKTIQWIVGGGDNSLSQAPMGILLSLQNMKGENNASYGHGNLGGATTVVDSLTSQLTSSVDTVNDEGKGLLHDSYYRSLAKKYTSPLSSDSLVRMNSETLVFSEMIKNDKDGTLKKINALFERVKPNPCQNNNNGYGLAMGGSSLQKWMEAVNAVGNWYPQNVHEYNQSKSGIYTINGKEVMLRYDCSGFVTACLNWFTNNEFSPSSPPSSAAFDTNQNVANKLTSYGFKKLTRTVGDTSNLRAYDIIGHHGHIEIYIPDKKQFGWGGVHSHHPCGGKEWNREKGKNPYIWRLS